MSTSHFRLFAALRPLSFIVAATTSFLAFVPLAQANPHILVDVQTGRVLEHEEAFRKWYPASLTKLMTVYTVFDAIRAGQISLDTPIVMSKRAAAQPAAKMYFKPGQKLTLDSALKILMVKSANDIAVAVAEAIGGTQEGFVTRMNGEALKLGMTDSHFVNPNGLPGKGQYTTARDLAVLTVALRRDFPQYAGYFSLEGFTTGQQNVPSLNMLIGRFAGADGMKTGFICASGFNQVSSATRDGRSVVSVVLGEDSLGARADESARLMQMALTTSGNGKPSLVQIPPYGETRDMVADVSKQICSKAAAKVRSEGRDEGGRQKLLSPYIHEINRPLNLAFAGLIAGSGEKAPKVVADQAGQGDAANVPIPVPRPTF